MSLFGRSAPGVLRGTSGRTVSKAPRVRRACMHKADRARRPDKERLVDGVLGIDIAKAKFDVTLLAAGTRRRKAFPNTPAGWSALLAWFERQGVSRVHATLEATGTYGEGLATWLHDHGHRVSVLNPAIIAAYAKAHLTRAKTDRVDADLIAA